MCQFRLLLLLLSLHNCTILCLKSSLAVGMTLPISYLTTLHRSTLPNRDEIMLKVDLRVSCVL
jgi:hypothetical protein